VVGGGEKGEGDKKSSRGSEEGERKCADDAGGGVRLKVGKGGEGEGESRWE